MASASSSRAKPALAPAPPTECAICCEKFNGSTRKAVVCGCEHVACRECTQRYLLESVNDPDCMACHRRWLPMFVHENFTKVFAETKLRKHREEVLFDREKSMLPATQELAEQRKKVNAVAAKLKQLRKQKKELDTIVRTVRPTFYDYILQFAPEERFTQIAERAKIEGDIASLNAQIKYAVILTERPELLSMEARPIDESARTAPVPARGAARQFIRACPAADCRGFLSTAWKCGMCETHVCSGCHEIKRGGRDDPDHVCDEGAVASARLIARDSRACPKCAASIYKIDGCDHMFCTACKTPFHWRTGEVMVRNSNPYFYEWMRGQAAAGDAGGAEAVAAAAAAAAPAGGGECNNAWFRDYQMISRYDSCVRTHMSGNAAIPYEAGVAMRSLPQSIAHNVHHVQTYMNVPERVNVELRVRYLIGEISEEKFKKELHLKERERNRLGEFNELFTMFNQVSSDIGLKVLMAKSKKDMLALIAEREKLCEFVTRTAESIAKCYNSGVYRVGADTSYEIRLITAKWAKGLMSAAGSSRASTSETNDGTDYETDSE